MIILGIDPGFGRIGYGIISYTKDKYKVIEYGCITTPENSYFPQRLNKIEEDLESILSRYDNIDVASIEDLYFNTNITTGIKVAQARGVIINTIYKHGIDVYEYTPIQAKQAVTGYGRANKTQVMSCLKKFLKMESMPKIDDTADALALATGEVYQIDGFPAFPCFPIKRSSADIIQHFFHALHALILRELSAVRDNIPVGFVSDRFLKVLAAQFGRVAHRVRVTIQPHV